jgi:hypothetical protein
VPKKQTYLYWFSVGLNDYCKKVLAESKEEADRKFVELIAKDGRFKEKTIKKWLVEEE